MHISRYVMGLALGLASLGCVSEAGRLGMPGDATAAEMQEAVRLRELALDRYLATDVRLQLVSQRLRAAGAPLCEGELNPVLGLALVGTRDVPPPHRVAAERRYPDARLRVVAVFDGMPAARAGVKPGDVIESIGGQKVGNFFRAYRASGGDAAQVEVALERDGRPMTVQLEKLPGCAYPAALFLTDQVNAFAATNLGYTVYTSALVRELREDTSLALVVGHEMAHNIINRLDGARPSSSRDHEARADYIGAYLAAAAGFPLSVSDTALFDVLTRGSPNEIGQGKRGSHPMSSARTLALKQTVAEIAAKQERGAAIRPEVR
jgi:beta-barrel assembly-enhancing protease